VQKITLKPLLIAASLGLASTAHAEPLAKPVNGPTTLCFKYSTFELVSGEVAVDFIGGLEGMRLEIEGPKGKYFIDESEIFAPPHAAKMPVSKRGMGTTYSLDEGGYVIFGPTTFSHGADRPVVRLSGDALKGTPEDAEIYRRFDIRDPRGAGCRQVFTYTWGF
jgi:hypothetical protein